MNISQSPIRSELEGVIDIHMHTAPDVRERSINDLQLMEVARKSNIRGVVIKSHFVPTMDRAWILRQFYPDVAVYGGIALNSTVGGLNPAAVEVAIKQGARILWLPTLHASQHKRMEKEEGGIESVRNGRVVPELTVILKMVGAANVILATGHLSAEEIFIVVTEAARVGVQKIVINHPEHAVVNMSIPDQKLLLDIHPVYFERCYSQPAEGGGHCNNLKQNLIAMHEVGIESTVVATDVGQVGNLSWTDALTDYVRFLKANGMREEDVAVMTKRNPARLLGLDAK